MDLIQYDPIQVNTVILPSLDSNPNHGSGFTFLGSYRITQWNDVISASHVDGKEGLIIN
jgi:hypothetical protein